MSTTNADAYDMTIKEELKLEKIAKRIVRQSASHEENIREYMTILILAALKEFNEDNAPTLEFWLEELFGTTLRHLLAIHRPS